MSRRFWYIFVVLIALVGVNASAQNNTSSPFSCFGLGDINDNVPNSYCAMGGVGIGMRGRKVICPAQPASYTACDSLTFMFDLAASVLWTRYGDDAGTRNKVNGNLEYINLQFPLYKRWVAFSAGLLPYSSVGYDLQLSDSLNTSYHYTSTYFGNGGISQVYGGLSVNVLDWLALGFNCYYMFGDVVNTRSVSFTETEVKSVVQASSTTVSSVRFREGLQLFHQFGKHDITLGAIFENKCTLHSDYVVAESSQLDTVGVATNIMEIPMMWGVGASYCWDNRLTVGFDFSRTYWADTKRIEDIIEPLRNRNRYALGVEYRHNPIGRNYADRIYWRLGCNVADSYVTSMTRPDMSVSIGIGLPLRNSSTVFNASIEYGHRGNVASLREDYMRLTINASICENWFFKRKL